MTFDIRSILGKPLSELTDEELRARLFELKQQRISKQQNKIKSVKAGAAKKATITESLIEAAIAMAKEKRGNGN